jgi:Leucine-rich repeat (LRR) protein
MGPLNSLSLPNCRITLSAQSASALAGMEGIEYLDLAHNPLQLTPDFSQMQSLATVVMHDTGLREIPRGLLDKAALDWVDLSNNAITDVPSDILEMTTDQADVLHLSNNPFSEATLLRLIAHYEKTGIDFGIEAVIQRGEVQMATSDESEADE